MENKGFVYFFSNSKNIKIGYTKNRPESRLKQLNTGSDTQLYMLGYIHGSTELEKSLHKKFGQDRIRQNAEWFYPSQELIDFINENNEIKDNYIEFVDNKCWVFKRMPGF